MRPGAAALGLAASTYPHGPAHVFRGAARSSVVDAVNRALNAGQSLEGAQLGPVTLHGVAAETYGSDA